MALTQKPHWFRPGRGGGRNPGILAVDDRYEFTAHESSNNGSSWSYSCKFRLAPKVKCTAKAKVVAFEDKWILQSADDDHSCEPNRARVTAELLRYKMKMIVRSNPTQAVGKAVRAIRIEAAEEYRKDKDFYSHLVAELGTGSALEKQLLRVRSEVIGNTPKSRNGFNATEFLKDVYGEQNDIVVCDSNDLTENWREEIARTKANSGYDWEKLDENIANIEKEFHSDDTEIENPEPIVDENLGVNEKDLPKRVLAFTSKTLLEELEQNRKTSVDGTFKSSCSLWCQQFIWMIKSKGYWVPVVWGWLPDKTEISYKVFFLLIENKMKELGMNLKVESVICDFELNILKAIDQMLECDILGCFFHHKKCFHRRMDKRGFKTRYETDDHFYEFINHCSGLSHLPIEDIEAGLVYIEKKFEFEDVEATEFKADFIQYIQDFWIQGCLPPRVWNVFGRSEDLTNNNQEGYNSKFNKELKETHPSAGDYNNVFFSKCFLKHLFFLNF